jgi:DNA gyrase subunit A
MEQVKNIRANWLKVLWVKDEDELSWVKTTSWTESIFIATSQGKAIQFSENDVRPMWRTASWVRWIRLKPEDKVVEVTIVQEDKDYVFIVTENGMWKLTLIEEYKNQKRWWTWVKAMAVNVKTWKLISANMLSEDDRKSSEIILISKWGQTIRMNLRWIRKTSRVTQWVILTKLKQAGDKVVRASIVREWEEEEE